MALVTENSTKISAEIAIGRSKENPFLDKFSELIAPLDILPQDIGGDVLVVGHGPQFLERELVCSKESEFRTLGSQVNSLTLVDYIFPSDPQKYLQAVVKDKHPKLLPDTDAGTINYYQWSLKPALSGVRQPIFDVATFFRMENMQPQFPEILNIVYKTLRPMMSFVGSGGFDSLDSVRKMAARQFIVRKAVELPNSDQLGRHYQGVNVGFVLWKRPEISLQDALISQSV